MENNWRYKTLENLEKEKWSNAGFNSHLVERVTALRKMPLDQFTVEDLRLMINQQMGLKYLVPLAIEVLTNDLFAEGDLFEGDLLQAVLNTGVEYWRYNKERWLIVSNVIRDRVDELKEKSINTKIFQSAFL